MFMSFYLFFKHSFTLPSLMAICRGVGCAYTYQTYQKKKTMCLQQMYFRLSSKQNYYLQLPDINSRRRLRHTAAAVVKVQNLEHVSLNSDSNCFKPKEITRLYLSLYSIKTYYCPEPIFFKITVNISVCVSVSVALNC